MHIGFLFNSKYHSYSRLVLFYFEAHEHITSHLLVGAVCTYPVWTSTSWHVGAVLVLLPPTPWHFLVLPPGTEWAGWPGLALLSGCPAAQDSCLGSQCQLLRPHHLPAQENLPQGTSGLVGCQIPVLRSSLYFLVTVLISDSDCFISAT